MQKIEHIGIRGKRFARSRPPLHNY